MIRPFHFIIIKNGWVFIDFFHFILKENDVLYLTWVLI
jgi:hypothetical protein